MSLRIGTKWKWDYLSISAEFAAKIPFWCEMEEYITDAITRNAFLIGKSVSAFWENNPESWQNGQTTAISAFVTNYIEVVESLLGYPKRVIWVRWGFTLRLLEVNH